MLRQNTPNPVLGLGNLENMGGRNGVIANRYARATSAYNRRLSNAIRVVAGSNG